MVLNLGVNADIVTFPLKAAWTARLSKAFADHVYDRQVKR